MSDYLDLYDFRCSVARMYRQRAQGRVAGDEPVTVWRRFCAARDELFAHHPQSALDEGQRRAFRGLHYFPYNPALCFTLEVDTAVEPVRHSVAMNADEVMDMTTVGRVRFVVDGEPAALSLYWLEVYGGGLFLPFRDLTGPAESYGGGRYLFDTIKSGEALPIATVEGKRRITLDFNYAYNPSCAYNDRWLCPLAPVENILKVPVRAGELAFKA
jgi:uncharacterized protein